MSSFAEVVPWRNANLWKGVGLGVGVAVLAMVGFFGQLSFHRQAMSRFTEYDYSGPVAGKLARIAPGVVRQQQEDDVQAEVVQAEGPQIVRKARLNLQVADCAAAQKKIEELARGESGFIEASTVQENTATLTIRVPAARLDAVRARLRALAMRVNQDSVSAEDVSKQYYDREAHIRNLRAQEQQFLAIMKNAHSVPDVLAVTKSLTEVRGEIEQEEGDFRRLKDQVELSRIEVFLHAETASGVSWSLGASSRSAVNGLKESLASVADFLVWLVINVPVIVLWIAIVFVLVVAGWYVLRLAIRLLKAMFVSRQG
jgi:hypothetical protein